MELLLVAKHLPCRQNLQYLFQSGRESLDMRHGVRQMMAQTRDQVSLKVAMATYGDCSICTSFAKPYTVSKGWIQQSETH
jgi:hypothetical protein